VSALLCVAIRQVTGHKNRMTDERIEAEELAHPKNQRNNLENTVCGIRPV